MFINQYVLTVTWIMMHKLSGAICVLSFARFFSSPVPKLDSSFQTHADENTEFSDSGEVDPEEIDLLALSQNNMLFYLSYLDAFHTHHSSL